MSTSNSQKIYIQYSHDIDFDYTTGKYPDGTERDWDWEENYIPINHTINGRPVGKHVFMKIKVGSPSFWTTPIAISANVTNIETIVGKIQDDGVTFSFTIKLRFTDGTYVESNPITIRNGTDGTRIETAEVNVSGHLIMTYSDGLVIDAGKVAGEDGTVLPPAVDDNWVLSQLGGNLVWVDPATFGGGGGLYTNLDPTPTSIGGINAGSTFTNATMQQMWDDLLYPYQAPSFTSFSIASQSQTLEVGGNVSGGIREFNWATSNSANVNLNSIEIIDVTNSVTLGTGLANDGTEGLNIGSSFHKITNTSHQWRISGVNTNSINFSRNYNINWYWRLYYGESTNAVLNENEVEGLRVSSLTNSISSNYNFLANGYKYIAHASSLGTLSSFTDIDSGFAVPFEAPYTLSITNTNGIVTNYKIYRSTYQLGSAVVIHAS